jgi:hypothetical protein
MCLLHHFILHVEPTHNYFVNSTVSEYFLT